MVYRSGNPIQISKDRSVFVEADILNSKPLGKLLVFWAKLLNGIFLFDLGKELCEAVY